MRTLFSPLTLLFLAVLSLASPAQAAREASDFLVIAAAGQAPVRSGDTLAPGQELTIAEGVTVLVLTRSGGVLRMTGPCNCRLPDKAETPRADVATRGFKMKSDLWNVAYPKLQSLSKSPESSADRGGQVVVTPDPPDLWAVEVDQSGNRCVRRGEAFLWRQQAGAAATVDLRTTKAHQKGLTWPAGQPLMQLPGEFVEDGAPLILSIDSQRLRLVVHVLPVTIDESEWGEILIWMAARDCRRQAQFLVDGLNNGTLFPDHDARPGLSEL